MPLAAIVVGWPAVVASISLVLAGVVRGRPRVVLAGALLGCPFLLYLSGSPGFGWLAVAVGALYIGSSQAVASSRKGIALALTTPFIGLAGFVAWLVLNQ